MSNDATYIIEPMRDRGNGVIWEPEVGPEAQDFLDSAVPERSRDTIRDEAASVLGKGVHPERGAGRETGLVVGYVQSGKTMSFEAVAALARDNGFQLVIVLAGTTNPLLKQSTGRIRRDLQLDDSSRPRSWMHFLNPERDDSTIQTLRDVFDDWRDTDTPDDYKMTVLVTVLKHHQRLSNLTSLLEAVGMDEVPTLVIDDEADQASLNTEVSQDDESTTYSRLMDLRHALPFHTFLQYTATPQAPLLISITDALSPNFVELLTPGDEYVGGEHFFVGEQALVRTIPDEEVPTRNNPLLEPPASLLEALRVFMVGVAAGLHQHGNRGNRSMLVHPSHLTAQHQEFYNWVSDIFDEWKRLLALADDDPDKQQLMEDLREAHSDLESTVGEELPSFDELAPTFRFAFRRTRLLEVNARGGETPQVDWGSAYGWILVGGQAMDRGFTIEGLTVTYMPRGIGVGNADTVQQRARFFGYKRSYLGYCRVYLEDGTRTAFERYVEHEQDIRQQLEDLRDQGHSLNDWKRAFILDNALRPCRQSVLEFDYIRGRFADTWVNPRVVLAADPVVEDNRNLVEAFIHSTEFTEADGHEDRTAVQRHHIAEALSLRDVMEQLLIPMRITSSHDTQQITGLLLQLSRALEDNPDEICTVYLMSPNSRRERGVDESGEVTNLYQGQAPVTPPERRGQVYPGDRAIRGDDQVTVQIHRLNLTRGDRVIAEDVPVLAVWVPRRMAVGWIDQDQPDQAR